MEVLEIPSGEIDGINDTFSTSFDFVAGTVFVWLNGIIEKDMTEISPDGFMMGLPPSIGDELIVRYIR